MKNPNAEGPSYILVSEQFAEGGPFGYVEDDHFVIIAPAENECYLATNDGEIIKTDQSINEYLNEEITATINAVYPSVGYLTFQVKQFSVGDVVKIGDVI